MIKEFQGEYRWLSNFAPVEIELDGQIYPSVEHAYMSAKSNDVTWKLYCANPQNTAGQVKRQSKTIKLVSNWEEIKLDVMKTCVEQKFNTQPYLSKLINTNDEFIQEGNYWGDKFWGICLKTNQGQNHLGKIIMKIRNELNNNNK